MTEIEKEQSPDLTIQALVQHVFSSEHGQALVRRWMECYGLTAYTKGPKSHEDLIRQDERQRFLFSIVNALNLTEQQLFQLSMQYAERVNQQKHNQKSTYE